MTNMHLEELAEAIEPDGVASLIEIYIEDTPRLMGEIRNAHAQSDADAMRSATHTLKSSARYLGAIELSELCEQIERECRDGQFESACGRLQRLEELVEQANKDLQLALVHYAGK